jgi:hypothetical protein
MGVCNIANLTIDDLAIQIDTTNINSWNLNDSLILNSLNYWNSAISDDLNLTDFGLTGLDNGRIDSMLSGITISKNDIFLNLYRVGEYSDINNISYDNYNIIPYTGTSVGNYFNLNGGYFQGFFKLFDYNYEIFPPRSNNGITIETLIELLPDSKGIFFSMGLRAEDKYIPYYSGETVLVSGTTHIYGHGKTGYTQTYNGIKTSENNYLNSVIFNTVTLDKFQKPEESTVIIDNLSSQLDNINNNIIAFEITPNKKIKYKYINSNGDLIQDESPNILSKIGWTLIDIVYKPYNLISNYNKDNYKCFPRRKGDLIFYVNGKVFWKITEFDEFYFNEINNNKEKQLGVPFNISWGGGSFGLKNSYHFNNLNTTDTISKDNSKNNLIIQKYFDNSFIGNIQKLRIYTKALNNNQIFGNIEYELYKNPNYNINLSKGGRIINQY